MTHNRATCACEPCRLFRQAITQACAAARRELLFKALNRSKVAPDLTRRVPPLEAPGPEEPNVPTLLKDRA